MKKLCDGSRRPVRGTRHEVKTTASRHSSAVCPVCKRRMMVNRVLGLLEFPRHLERTMAKVKAKPAAKPKTKPTTKARAKTKSKATAR